MPRPPRPPKGYQSLNLDERRRGVDLGHNRRQGWMLHLADRHRLVPVDGPIDACTEIAELLLPDLFPADGTVDAALYAGIIDDLELALDLLDDPTLPIRALLPSGRAITLVSAAGVDLTALGLKTAPDRT